MAKEPKLEHSDFSGEFEDDGITVLVDIHRPAGSQGGWALEVISQEEDVTTWEDTFETDKDAWEEFLATTERDGIRSFIGGEDGESVH
jgi:aryl-phospho-beta-D-glucosidase BglC (GH1 family)